MAHNTDSPALMSAAFAPSSWPALPATQAAAPRRGTWRFAESFIAAADAEPGTRWRLARNCSISPRQMLAAYALLCAVALAVATGFAIAGAPVVMAFAGIELVLVGAAMLFFARHAADRETLTLVGRSLLVEQAIGARLQRFVFAADWLSVEPAAGQNSLVVLSGQGHRVQVGRFLRPELRAEFARELRQALHGMADPNSPTSNPS
jgi:uncharacterized membrane protein